MAKNKEKSKKNTPTEVRKRKDEEPETPDYDELGYQDYWGEVCDELEVVADLDRSDAQGVMMVFEDTVRQHFKLGTEPIDTAKIVDAISLQG